jgi:hypothetical protein
MNIKPLLLSALMVLPVLGVANAQSTWERRHEIHHDLRQNQRELHQALRNGDYNTARHEAHQIRRDERRLDRNTYNLQRNNYNYNRYNNGYNYHWNNTYRPYR